jgi:hypothetical protein
MGVVLRGLPLLVDVVPDTVGGTVTGVRAKFVVGVPTHY